MVICGQLWCLGQRKVAQILRWFLPEGGGDLTAGADIVIKRDWEQQEGHAGRGQCHWEREKKKCGYIQRRVGFPTW